MSWLKGESGFCAKCGRMKRPRGRSAPVESANGYCDSECLGYEQSPLVGDLWPGDTRQEFGYPKACPVCEMPITALRERDERGGA